MERIPPVAVPDTLHLAVDSSGERVTEPYDRGVMVEFAYSIAGDRPAGRGTSTRQVSRQSLIDDETSGRYIVQVDAAADRFEGLPVVGKPIRDHGLLPIPTRAVHALPITAIQGIWAEIVRDTARPQSAWRLFESASRPTLNLVIDRDPAEWRARATTALGQRPHPEITVVEDLDEVPRIWRNAARHLLAAEVSA